MKLLKRFGILVGACLWFELAFTGAMQESETGVSTINDNLEFLYSLALLIGVGLFIKKITSKSREKVFTNGRRKETAQEMYSRAYGKSTYKEQKTDDIACIYCKNTFNGKEATYYNVACDTIICPHCGHKMKVIQKVEYTCYAIEQ